MRRAAPGDLDYHVWAPVAIALAFTLAGIGAVWQRARAWLSGRRDLAVAPLAPLPQG